MPPPKYKKIAKSGLALLFGLSMILSACIPEPENPTIQLSETSQLAQVRDWFEANKTKLRLPERGTNYRTESQELILPFFEKKPDWEQFHHYYFPDGREVFETSLENANNYFPSEMAEAFSGQNPSEIMIQNILFVRHTTRNQFNVVIARYYPGNEESKINFNEISYNQIPVFWTGKLELFTYDERFFVGFEFEEGEMISSYTRQLQIGDRRKNEAGMDVRCTTRYIPVYYTLCVSQEGFPPNCTKEIDYFVEQISCYGADGGRPSYSYMGGGNPRESDPATDGGGKNNTDPTPPEMPKPGIINNLTNKCADGIFKEIKKTGIKSNEPKGTFAVDQEILKLFDESTKYDYVIQNSDKPNQTTPVPDIRSGKSAFLVNLNNDYLSKATQLSIARTIIHESIHAFIEYKLVNDGVYYSEFTDKYSDYLRRKSSDRMNRAQHELMAEYIEVMAYSLKQWDREYGNGKMGKPLLDDDYYRAMAFGGLLANDPRQQPPSFPIPTDSFKALVPKASDRMKIIKIIQNEQEGNQSKGTKCN